jgi:glycosyltransferase involved in cell wall biosynthesis
VTPNSPLEHGGVERHVMEVSRRLVEAGQSVEVLCADRSGPSISEKHEDGVLIRAVHAWPEERDYYVAPGLWREMARGSWDVIHMQSYHTFVAPLAMLRALSLHTPYVVTFHGGGHSSRLRGRLRGPHRRALRPLLIRAARLVAVARFEIELYGDALMIPPEKFVLIPNGSDIFVSADEPTTSTQAGLFASIGRLERYKGHHRVIAAIPYVLERRPDAKLLVVGSGPYEPALRRQIAKLGVQDHVEITSVSPRDRGGMAKLLSHISLVVLLSEFETGSLAALEALAAGCRLLVADTAGLKELVDDGLARGIDPGARHHAIACAILEELDRPRQRRIVPQASWDERTARLLELYRSVARDRERSPARTAHPMLRAGG